MIEILLRIILTKIYGSIISHTSSTHFYLHLIVVEFIEEQYLNVKTMAK